MTDTRGRALIVDEDPLVTLAIDRQLDALGWDAISAHDGTEVIRLLESRLLVDAIVMNERLPDLEIEAVIWAIRKLAPGVRVIIMGDNAGPGPTVSVGVPFLTKPVSTLALRDALAGAPPLWRK